MPSGVFRVAGWIRVRLSAVLADAPLLFFGVVIGVAVLFKVAIGWAKGDAQPEPGAPAVLAAPHQRAKPVIAVSGDTAIAPAARGAAPTAGTQIVPGAPAPRHRRREPRAR